MKFLVTLKRHGKGAIDVTWINLRLQTSLGTTNP